MPLLALPVLAAIGTGLAGAGLVTSIVQGNKQNANAKKSLQNQQNAQTQAEQQALSTERKNEVAQNAANMKTPDIASILSRAANSGKQGVSSTMLTGPSGIDPTSLNLGRSTLLGS